MALFCCLLASAPAAAGAPALESLARACSPRVERHGSEAVVFDVSGLERVIGPPAAIATEVRRMSAGLGPVRLAMAGSMTTAWLIAHAGAIGGERVAIVPAGEEAARLAALEIGVLDRLPDAGRASAATRAKPDRRRADRRATHAECLTILRRWGLRTLGDLARLPEADVRTRLGEVGARLHRAARGLDAIPLVPTPEPIRFVERLELEWPVEGLEPLSFVLARLCEALSAALERADRGAVTVVTRLRLVTRAVHARTLQWPAPIRDPRVLRTLILLDLESHPPDAAIDVVELDLGVTPARIVQGALLSRSLPSTEDLATLVARLGALMGDTRVGAPRLLDTYDERAVAMQTFNPREAVTPLSVPAADSSSLTPCLRRFHLPVAAAVVLDHGAPAHITLSSRGLPGGRIVTRAGPWRSSGRWWVSPPARPSDDSWDRDEWDVEVAPAGCIYRLARDRMSGQWQVLGTLD